MIPCTYSTPPSTMKIYQDEKHMKAGNQFSRYSMLHGSMIEHMHVELGCPQLDLQVPLKHAPLHTIACVHTMKANVPCSTTKPRMLHRHQETHAVSYKRIRDALHCSH